MKKETDMQYGMKPMRAVADLSQLDLEWAEAVAGRRIQAEEALELMQDYIDWVEQMEDNDVGPEIYAETP
jgi:hypothetical protein